MSLKHSIQRPVKNPITRALTAGGGGAIAFVSNGVLSSRVTFARASTGTYFDSAGVLQTAAIDVPRVDYNPSTLALRGLMVQEQRTNLLLRSQEFDNASWAKLSATVTANAATAPDGALAAYKIAETAVTDAHQCSQIPTLADSISYALSVFAKSAERSFLRLTPTTKAGVTSSTYFNLLTGAVGTVGAGHTASIQSVGGGWYRCSIVYNSSTGATATTVRVGVAASDNQLSYAGSAGSGILVFGAQLEAGAFSTSYIVTTASTQTRSIDDPDFTVPSGVVRLEYTYDDDTTANVVVTPGAAYQIPTSQKRVKRLLGFFTP